MPNANKVQFSITPDQIDLDRIFQRYCDQMTAPLSEEQRESIKPVFYSGASAVLSIFDQLSANVMAVEMETYEGLADGEAPSEEAMQEVDAQCDLLQQAMTTLMNNICDYFDMPNTSAILNDDMTNLDIQTVALGEGESEAVSKDFDLANWNPTKGAN